MKTIFLPLILLLTPLLWRGAGGEVKAQNLVKNPSFENYIQCPNGFGLFNGYVQDWFGFNPSSPSFFHSCASLPDRVPENSYGFQFANTGDGYACILTYNWNFDPDKRNYIEGNFVSILKKDSVYCINYFVNLCNTSLGAIRNLDAYISDTLLDWNNGTGFILTNITPQIKSTQLLNDTANWIKVNGLYKAHGGEQYITIGNFLPDAQTTILSYSPGNPIRIDYYIDDVSVVPTGLSGPNLGNDTIICKNTLPYNLTAPTGYDSYLWSNGSISNSISVNDSGTYWVRCTLADCGQLTDSVHIGFNNIPQLNLGNDTVVCTGTAIKLTAQTGFTNYMWNTSDTTQSIMVTDSGMYILNANTVCGMQTDSVKVSIDSLPNLMIDIGTDTTLCKNGINVPITLSASTLLPNYHWSTGATTAELTVTQPGIYYLRSEYRCGSITSESIYVKQCPEDSSVGLYIPDCFTPDNDGLNDYFAPVFNNIKIEEIKVYNRWGNVVYVSSTEMKWDGSWQNKVCPLGVYVYKVSYRDKRNGIAQKTGRVLLLR